MKPGASAWLAVLALVVALVGFELTNLDLWVQDHFYAAETQRWIVDEKAPLGRALFYHGPKVIVWVVGLAALTLALGPGRWRERWQLQRRGLWLAVLVIATVPALAGLGKKYTNMFCPSEIRRYGGEVAYVKLCEPHPPDDPPPRRGGCFPAGHASGGFALMGLLAVRGARAWRRGAILAGFALGWWMGGYQMLKGAHYLSHTVVTMLVAWLVVRAWSRVLKVDTPVDQAGR